MRLSRYEGCYNENLEVLLAVPLTACKTVKQRILLGDFLRFNAYQSGSEFKTLNFRALEIDSKSRNSNLLEKF